MQMKKYIIFGAGMVGEKKFRDLEKQNIQIVCFIDTMMNKEEFLGIPVHNLDYLSSIQVNDYFYVIGSIASADSMIGQLIKYGVKEENIVQSRDYSESSFEKNVISIKEKILLYPAICNENDLLNLEKIIDNYFPLDEIYFSCIITNPLNHMRCKKIELIEEFQEDVDLVLVWDSQHLNDTFLTTYKNVYCIDDKYYNTISERILLRLHYKLFAEQEVNNSKLIIKQLKSKHYEKCYVFGSGPSLKIGLEKLKKEKEKKICKIACNTILDFGDDLLDEMQPDIYTISDQLFLAPELESFMYRLIQYIMQSKCILMVPIFWIPYLIQKYDITKDKIFGLELDSPEINCPSEYNIKVYNKVFNVITVMSIPIACTLSNLIYIFGCDGKNFSTQNENKKGWDYASVSTVDPYCIYTADWEDYYYRHALFFEEILMYFENNGKSFYSSSSNIPCLKQRTFKNLFLS